MNKKLEIENKENLKDYYTEEESNSQDDSYSYNDNEDYSSVLYSHTDPNSIWTNIERDLDDFIENLLQ